MMNPEERELYERNRKLLRTYTRTRQDFIDMRKSVEGRLEMKADGTPKKIENPRHFEKMDWDFLCAQRLNIIEAEKALKKRGLLLLGEFKIWTDYLEKIKAVGDIAAGWIIGEFDIFKADTPSKLWQFSGMNSGDVRGKKMVGTGKNQRITVTDKMIRGDKLTAGFLAPFNKKLRAALLGVMGDGFIKAQNEYAFTYYYPKKNALEHSENTVMGGKKAWKDVSKGHRHRAAIRYMVKMFLQDLYNAWRPMEGLYVRPPYREEKLGIIHHVAEASCDQGDLGSLDEEIDSEAVANM